jgi:hypothetical protein
VISKQRLDELQALADSASLGPWLNEPHTVYIRMREADEEFSGSPSYEEAIFEDKHVTDADRLFIAAARQAVPELIAAHLKLKED